MILSTLPKITQLINAHFGLEPVASESGLFCGVTEKEHQRAYVWTTLNVGVRFYWGEGK